MKLVSWIKDDVVTLVDPDREERLLQQTSTVQTELKRSWGRFDRSAVQQSLQISDREMIEVAERVFRNIIKNGWKDGVLAEDEKETLARAAGALQIPKDRASELNESAGLEVFESCLGRVLEDGVVDLHEEAGRTSNAAHSA